MRDKEKMSILISIGMWLLKIVCSPEVKMILTSVIEDLLKTISTQAAPAVIIAVKEAMARDDLNNSQKFDYVQAAVLQQFPNMEKSALNALIENTLNALKK
jgi:hypothetical protein